MPLPRPIRQRSPIAHDGIGHALLPGHHPRRQRDVRPDHGAGADADVALVDDRRRREADHAAAHRRHRSAGPAPGRGPIAPSSWISSHPRWTSSPAPRLHGGRRPVPRRVGDRGPAQHAGRRYRRRGSMAACPLPSARVVQITDTHFSAASRRPAAVAGVLDWLAADPPDLLVHTGDIVFEDPDDDDDRAFAKALLDQVARPLRRHPGQPRHRLLRRGGRPAAPARHVPGHVGRRPLRPRPRRLAPRRRRRLPARHGRRTTTGCARR